MSSSIWMQCEGPSRIAEYSKTVWRCIESQNFSSTRKLVDSQDEHEVLEAAIDASKPRVPTECDHLPYLLFTPFRYPPLRFGSRFGVKSELGIWYGAEDIDTCFAETAFYRLWFLEDTAAEITPIVHDVTVYEAFVSTQAAVDLTVAPFDAFRPAISSKTSCGESQLLGSEMRAAGVEAFRYHSARHAQDGFCVGVLKCTALDGTVGRDETWQCFSDRGSIEFRPASPKYKRQIVFPRSQFEVEGSLPSRPT